MGGIKAYSSVTVTDVSDGLISSVDVWYYLSSSSTNLSDGMWSTTPPDWIDGKYYWQKTVTTYKDGNTSETDAVCITGGTGITGATGRGIVSITEEYATSNNKTNAPSDEDAWSDVVPEWTSGTYIWTRSKITYSNPSGIEYTTPVCDSTWEAVNDLEDDFENRLTEITSTISGVESKVDKNTKSITDKVWQSDTYTVLDKDGNIVSKSLKDIIAMTTTDISGITSTVSEVQTNISDIEGEIGSDGDTTGNTLYAKISQAQQTADKFYWLVKSGDSASSFEITDRLATLTADYINLNGLVTFSGLNSDTQSKINDAVSNAAASYAWTNSNGSNMTALRDMVLKWTNNAVSTNTYIQGGWIATDTITANQIASNTITTSELATDAIKSLNYSYTSGNYSDSGSFFDLSNGIIRTPAFGVGEDGAGYFKGTVYAEKGQIGELSIHENGTLYSEDVDMRFYFNLGTRALNFNWNSLNDYGTSYGSQLTSSGLSITYSEFTPDGIGHTDTAAFIYYNDFKLPSGKIDGDLTVTGDIICNDNSFSNIVSKFSDYLPLAGGTMTGSVTINNNAASYGMVWENSGSAKQKVGIVGGTTSQNYPVFLWDYTNSRIVCGYNTSGDFVVARPINITGQVNVTDKSVIVRNSGTGTYGFNTYKTVDSVEHRGYFGWSSSGNSIWKKYNAGTQKNYISMSDTNVYFDSSVNIPAGKGFYLGNGVLNCTSDQNLFIGASAETDYRMFFGVRNSMWTWCPAYDRNANLGTPSYRYNQVYAYNTTISTSDRNEKNTIKDMDSEFWVKFIKMIKPVTFKYNNGTSDRTHTGMISQDIEDIMVQLGMDSKDFAGFTKFQKEHMETRTRMVLNEETGIEEEQDIEESVREYDENGDPVYGYGLRYEEFVAPMISVIQYLLKEVETLKSQK